jgi:hypothetical protein
MKIRIALFSLLSTLFCFQAANAASWPEMYIGVQGGLANTNFSKGDMMVNGGGDVTSANINNHIAAIRGYAGYRWSEYVAAEIGYLRPRSTRFLNVNDGTVPNGNVTEYAIDFTGKVFLPMAAYIHLSPYLKAGGAYMDAESHGGVTRNGVNDFGYSLHPILGAGIGYNFTPYLVGDISWTNVTQRNSNVPQLNLFFVGLTYYFSFQEAKSGAPNYGGMENEDT